MKDFMLIFRSPMQTEEDFMNQSPAEMQAEMEKWNTWMGAMAQQGKLVGGQPLLPSGKILKGTSKKLTDGPYMEGKEIVGGYLLIKAENYEDAIEMAKGAPTLGIDEGVVEVREIMEVPAQ